MTKKYYILLFAVAFNTSFFSTSFAQDPTVVIGAASSEFRDSMTDAFGAKQLRIDESRPGEILSDLGNGISKLLIERFDEAPEPERIQLALDRLANSGSQSSYLIFVDQGQNVDWLRDVLVPDSVRLSVSVKGMEALDIAAFLEDGGIPFDPADIRIKYKTATRMALSQLADAREGGHAELVAWEGGEKTYLGVFDGIISKRARSDDEAAYYAGFLDDEFELPDQWNAENGVEVVPTFGSVDSDFGIALVKAIAKSNCSGQFKWDGMDEIGVLYQSYGFAGR